MNISPFERKFCRENVFYLFIYLFELSYNVLTRTHIVSDAAACSIQVSVVFSPQANYTDRAIAVGQRS
jgi:hypothetical protein